MYRTLKNFFLKPSRKKRRSKWRSQVADVEPDIRQVIESSQRQTYTYLNVSDDLGRPDDDSSTNECTQFETIAEVHFTDNVAPVTAFDMSPKLTSDLMNVAHNKLLTVTDPSPPARASFDLKTPKSDVKSWKGEDLKTPEAEQPPSPSPHPFEKVADFFHQFADLRTDVRIMMANQSLIYLLGTNHADPQCPVDVSNIIKKVGPQLVIIELCAWRACGCDVHRGNVFQTKPEFTFRYLRRVISQIGFLPAMIFFTDAFNEHHAVTNELLDYGGEFAVAARLCEELGNCKILLGDREIPITVKRQASGMGNWRGIRISILVTLALIFKRRMKTLLLRGHQLVIRDPRFYQIVVLERDIFLTYMIQVAAGMKHEVDQAQIVAVVGQGHLNGIQRFWGRILPQILPLILKPDLDF
ncbi:hypothetical protein V9T40_000095 [Parthenolecanium corni]|uniref:Uncharacterized protein n=1 Tax=Parthenolecanium corni TaxID=536013 RepID=A0AAN9THU0_9HEMI